MCPWPRPARLCEDGVFVIVQTFAEVGARVVSLVLSPPLPVGIFLSVQRGSSAGSSFLESGSQEALLQAPGGAGTRWLPLAGGIFSPQCPRNQDQPGDLGLPDSRD